MVGLSRTEQSRIIREAMGREHGRKAATPARCNE